MRTAATLILLLALASSSRADVFGAGENRFVIDFVPIGNPGNAPDTTGKPIPAGSVGYEYRIGKHEVSKLMVAQANNLGGLGITLGDYHFQNGYYGNLPAIVTWGEAARFVNWLNTSHEYAPAYKFALQPGDVGYHPNADFLPWNPRDPGFDAENPYRNSNAHYYLPDVDEWYKAAYYDPNANGGLGGYWDYPTASNSPPVRTRFSEEPGTAVFGFPASFGPVDIKLAGGLSPYGVMALGGNVEEWNEERSTDFAVSHVVRGGGWAGAGAEDYRGLSAKNQSGRVLSDDAGFRVAAQVPEPGAGILAASGALAILGLGRRRTAGARFL